MKALSIWQPWASLIMSGHKKIETRSWPAPYSIRGQRIAIASTKTIRPDQRQAAAEDDFRMHYAGTGLPALEAPDGQCSGHRCCRCLPRSIQSSCGNLRNRRKHSDFMGRAGLLGFLGSGTLGHARGGSGRAGALELEGGLIEKHMGR